MSDSEEIRHQVAIAGQVTDAQTDRALAGAQVKIVDAPAAFVAQVVITTRLADVADPALAVPRAVLADPGASAAEKLQAAQAVLDYMQARRMLVVKRREQTRTAADGIFYFLDLPDGAYTLTASLSGSGSRYGAAQVTTAVSSPNGAIDLATADMALPPTTLRGQITGPSLDDGASEPVFMAEVRVKGSGERAFSDSDGQYLLAGLEVGERTISVSARGYATTEKTVQLDQAGTEQFLNFTLVL
jgi:hypothetical protein